MRTAKIRNVTADELRLLCRSSVLFVVDTDSKSIVYLREKDKALALRIMQRVRAK